MLKPNFNSADPAPGSTDNDVLRTQVEELWNMGAQSITVADRSGMGDTRRVMEQKGIFNLAQELGFETLVFDDLEDKDWVMQNPRDTYWQKGYPIARPCLEADALIQTCCLKTHRFGGHFTLSLKNSVGMVAKFGPGDGWIDSPAGAYTPDPSLAGKATFGFVAKYKKGASKPDGSTQFQFSTADLNFHSTDYDWLVIATARAQYKGSGTINGSGDYGFRLTAIDAGLTPSTDVDLLRIKIWDKEDGDAVIYDNQVGPGCSDSADGADPCTEIGGGSIVIHTGKKK